MRPSLAFETHRHAIREIVKKYPTVNPRVFGSVLHGTDHEESDLDVLVDALPGATLLRSRRSGSRFGAGTWNPSRSSHSPRFAP